MNKQEIIKLPECPQWLKNADWEGDVEIVNGCVIWKNGVWKNGVWKGGIWEYGTWENGTWEDGIWEYGIWEYGTWENGTWEDGIWEYGTWENGTWEDGIWEYGTWENGIWERGCWKDGIWKGGYREIGFCKWRVLVSKIKIRIGCEEKTTEGWINFFESDKEYETSRGSEQFKDIYKSFLLAKEYQKLFFEVDVVIPEQV